MAIGQKVFAKLCKYKNTEWFPGIIGKTLGNVNFEVEIENIPEFREVKPHINQLRPRHTETNVSSLKLLFNFINLTHNRTGK